MASQENARGLRASDLGSLGAIVVGAWAIVAGSAAPGWSFIAAGVVTLFFGRGLLGRDPSWLSLRGGVAIAGGVGCLGWGVSAYAAELSGAGLGFLLPVLLFGVLFICAGVVALARGRAQQP